MTTPSAPNGISMSQINTEVGYPSTQALNFNNVRVRALAGVFTSGSAISMSSLRGKTYVTKAVFSTIGATTFTVPTTVTSINVKLWGAGGGGGPTEGLAEGGSGGSGAYVAATISVTPGETLYVFVPSGGQGAIVSRTSGAGGSWAGIFRGTTPLALAAGGGGAGGGRDTGQGTKNGAGGGGGGGLDGANGVGAQGSTTYGRGGTTTAGGIGGPSEATDGGAGTYLKGGDGGASSAAGRGDNGASILGAGYGEGGDRSNQAGDRSGGGGGGAGYYGGGGGGQGGNAQNNGGSGGGGGASFHGGPGVSGSSIAGTTGASSVAAGALSDTAAPNTGDADYVAYGAALSVGVGLRAEVDVRGGQGLVVISWSYG